MRIVDTVSSALKSISTNGSRTLLTMLGIIIGVGSVTLMTGIGKSMEGVILSQISILGPNNMVIFPGTGPEGGGGTQRAGFDSISLSDVEALSQLRTIADIAPIINVTEPVTAGRETSDSQIVASTPLYFLNYSISPMQGRLFDEDDERGSRRVAVIGSDTANDLYYGQNAIGKKLKVGNTTFTVVGVAEPLGTAFFQNQDVKVYIPFSVGRELTGQSYVSAVVFLRTVDADLAQRDVEAFLRQRNGITDPDDDDFLVRNSQQAEQILGSVSIGLTAFITFIAAISLIVGGIGIMNIMLVAVTERTREIGLRKALGARRQDISRQFIIEAIGITFIGGVVGIILGIFGSFFIALVVQRFLNTYSFTLSVPAIIMALAMAMCTGFMFGVYPAKKASRLPAMEALRYE